MLDPPTLMTVSLAFYGLPHRLDAGKSDAVVSHGSDMDVGDDTWSLLSVSDTGAGGASGSWEATGYAEDEISRVFTFQASVR